MSGSEYILWSYGQFEKMTFFPPDPLPKNQVSWKEIGREIRRTHDVKGI